MGSGEPGAGEPQPGLVEGLVSADVQVEVLTFWDASCLLLFMRLSSSLRLFAISPFSRGVSRKTDPDAADVELMAALAAAAAAAAAALEDCGSKPCLH